MKSILLFLFCLHSYFLFSQSTAQLPPSKLNFGVESNILSWLGGHAGPDLRFSIWKSKWEGYVGAKYSFYNPYPVSGKPEDNLLFYRQRFSHGIDFTAGFRYNFGIYSIGKFIHFGEYNYNNSRIICVGGQEVFSAEGDRTGYFKCQSWATNNFKERARVYGAGIEQRLRLYERSRFSAFFGMSAQLNLIYTSHLGYIRERDENGLFTGYNETKPELHKREDRVWLNNIPLFHSTRSISETERFWFAVKVYFIVRYTL